MIIYKAQNKINGKIYIGQSINSLEHRKNQHYREAKSKNKNNYFHNALIKYTKDDFKWIILEECESKDDLNVLEIKYILDFNSTNRDIGYNRKLGGEQGLCSEETKKLIGKHTSKLWKNEEIASKMLIGLQKGTITIIENAKNNFIDFICPVCKKEIKIKPFDKRKTCSIKCGTSLSNNGLIAANKINVIKFNKIQLERKNKIFKWCSLNKEIFDNLKLNKLSFLKDLADYIGVSDIRTLTKVLSENSRKKFVIKLKNIVIENIC